MKIGVRPRFLARVHERKSWSDPDFRGRRGNSRLSPIFVVLLALPIGGCGTTSAPRKSAQADGSGPARPSTPGRGGYYLDDGPGENAPANLDAIPDAVPRIEPINRATSRPYQVMGRSFTPLTELTPYRERGMATWYGRRYHGKPTSSGEPYDMYRMTAAHPILPIPSYARITNIDNGRSVVVRINDRGPFIGERLIDVSYVAAHKLDLIRSGAALVEVEALLTDNTAQVSRAPLALPSFDLAVLTLEETQPAKSPAQTVALSAPASGHYVQLAAFAVKENADRFIERARALINLEQAPLIVISSGGLHRVQSGPYADRTAAEQAARRLEALLGASAILTVPR